MTGCSEPFVSRQAPNVNAADQIQCSNLPRSISQHYSLQERISYLPDKDQSVKVDQDQTSGGMLPMRSCANMHTYVVNRAGNASQVKTSAWRVAIAFRLA